MLLYELLSDVKHVLPTACVIAILYIITLALYRLYFHPLSRFPGPRLAALTEYWELYQDYFREESGHLFLELDELHKKYVVRIRPNEVHVKDSNWMDVLYTGPSDPRDRDPMVGTAFGTPHATIGTGPYELHKMRKSAIAPFFSTRSVSAMEPHIMEFIESLNTDLSNRVGEILDMRIYIFAWTTDYITDTIFNKNSNLFWKPDRAMPYFKIVWDFSIQFPLTKHMPWLVTTGLAMPLVVWRILFPSLLPWISIYKNLLAMAVKARTAHSDKAHIEQKDALDDETPRDIFDTILSSDLQPQDKTAKRMANEVFNLLIAGSLTTSKTATIAIFHVLDNSRVCQNLQAELFEAMPRRDTVLDVKRLQKLPLLTAVIRETMRIGCVVTTRFPMIARHKDLILHGQPAIPAGCAISMTFCKAAMDSEIFAKPDIFRPERWLDGSQQPLDYERYVLPFGRGSRVCIGQHLAYAQLYLLLANIFRKFNLELYDTTRERDINIKGGGPLGEPTRQTKGIRVRVVGMTEK